MNEQEVQKHAPSETASVDGRREVENRGRRATERTECQRCLPAARDRGRPVLRLGKEGSPGVLSRAAEQKTETSRDSPGSTVGGRNQQAAGGGGRTERREPEPKKRSLAVRPRRRYRAEEKELILETIRQARLHTGQPIKKILEKLGLSSATYYRWQARAQAERLTDEVVVPRRRVPRPTPAEIRAVCETALDYPQLGYKRLSWLMVDEDIAYLRPWQVYELLKGHDLLRRGERAVAEALRRPPEPERPDQVWHVDLMYLYIQPRWYYLVDILDGYSRFLVHWSLNLTMTADTVTLTVQEALDGLDCRRQGEPKLVHDHGSQFLSTEWRQFVEGAKIIDIRTRVAHPQSNGRLERLHRTHRQEGLTEAVLVDYAQAVAGMADWANYYNYQRPHLALKCMRPIDYYRGDPQARLAAREQKLALALEARKRYWQAYETVKER